MILCGGFKAQVETDARVWKEGLIGQHGNADVNDNGKFLLQRCYNNAMCIMNTFFQRRDLHKHIWFRDLLGQRSLIVSCIVSAELFQSLLDVCVKRGTQLLVYHYLAFSNLRLKKIEPKSTRTCRFIGSYSGPD